MQNKKTQTQEPQLQASLLAQRIDYYSHPRPNLFWKLFVNVR